MKQIFIDVEIDGSVKIETRGYSGGECQKASKDFERALGLVESDTKTAEYHSGSAVKRVENKA